MKKLISVLLVCLVMFTTLSVATLAQDEAISIETPANGAELSALKKVEATVNVLADNCIIRLDGAEIGTAVPAEGKISYEITEPLSIGSHTLDIIAVGEGISEMATSTFSIVFPYEMVTLEEGHENAPTVEKAAVTAKTATMKSTTSHDGTKAMAWEIPDTIGASDKQTYTIGGTYDGPAVIEVDMFFGTSLNMKIETKNKNNGWGSMFQDVFEKTVFDRSGMILKRDGTKSDKSYVCGKWFRLKIEGDFSKGSASMHIGKFDEEGNVTYETVIPEMEMGESFINLVQIRFEFSGLTYFKDYAEVKMIGIDNAKVTQKKKVSGFSKVSSPAHEDYVSESGNTVPAGVSKVRVLGASQYKIADFLPYLSAYVDGKEAEIASVAAEGDNLDITFKKAIGAQKNVKLMLEKDITADTNITCPLPSEYSFKTDAPAVCIESVSYKSDSLPLYSPTQIKAGAALECVFNLQNGSGASKPVVLVAALYKGDEMIDFEYLPYEISAGTSSEKISLSLPADYNGDDCCIEMFAVESFENSVPLSKMWRIAK